MDSTTRQTSWADASVCRLRSSTYTVCPAQSGSLGSGSAGVAARVALRQLVSTSPVRMRCSASRTARRYGVSPPSGCGTYSSMSCSRWTHSNCSDSMIGRASFRGMGVTMLNQCAASPGVSTGSEAIARCGSFASTA